MNTKQLPKMPEISFCCNYDMQWIIKRFANLRFEDRQKTRSDVVNDTRKKYLDEMRMHLSEIKKLML